MMNQEESKKEEERQSMKRKASGLQEKSGTQESQTQIGNQQQDSDDTFRRGSSLGSVMHDHNLIFGTNMARKKSQHDSSSNGGGHGAEGTQSENTPLPDQNTMGTASGPQTSLNRNFAKSKATSLIRRELEDEEDLQYSDSNVNTHYFKLDATSGNLGSSSAAEVMKRKRDTTSRNAQEVVPEEEDQFNTSSAQVPTALVNPSFIKDITLECSQLISNLNFNNHSQRSIIDSQPSQDDLVRNSHGSSSVLKKSIMRKSTEGVRHGSSTKKEQLGTSKSAKNIPPLSTNVQEKNDSFKSEAEVDDVLTQQNAINPSQRIIMADNSSAISVGGGPLTDTTHDLRTAAMEMQFVGNQPPVLLNVNSDTDTQYHQVNKTRDSVINESTNPIFVYDAGANSGNSGISNQDQDSKEQITNELSPYFPVDSQKSNLPFISRPLAAQQLATNTNLTQSNRITFRMQQESLKSEASPHSNVGFTNQYYLNHGDQLLNESSRADLEDQDDLDEEDTFSRAIDQPTILIENHPLLLKNDGTTTNSLRRYEIQNHDTSMIEGEINHDSDEKSEGSSSSSSSSNQEEQKQVPNKQHHREQDLRQSVHDLIPAQDASSIKIDSQMNQQWTDDVVYNRLPKNFFVQEAEEQFDLSEVMASIKRMRQDFVGYMNESKVQDKLEEINDMILQPPEKFIERQLQALGIEGGESILFEKVLQSSPAQSNQFKSSLGNLQQTDGHSMTMREAEPANPSLIIYQNHQPVLDMFGGGQQNISYDQIITSSQHHHHHQDLSNSLNPQRVQFYEPSSLRRSIDDVISQKGNVEVIEEQMSKRDYDPFPNKLKEDQNFYAPSTQKTNINNVTLKSAKQQQQQQHPHMPKQQAIKNIKMADYFRDSGIDTSTTTTNVKMATNGFHQDYIVVVEEETNESVQEPRAKERQSRSESPDGGELPQEIKQQLVERLEQEILGNIDVNFLFHKGERLRFGLIDQHRLYKIMLKIKEVAQKQIYERSSRQIDYTKIVQYLEEEDQYLTQGEKSRIHQLQTEHQHKFPTAEPKKTKIPQEEVLDEAKWIQVVDFLRKNPKLMLQMLPGLDQDEETQISAVVQNTQNGSINQQAPITNMQQVQDFKKQDEQRRISKLKALSSKYTTNRKDFLEAIDRFQEKELLSSPKGPGAILAHGQSGPSKQKQVQVKSISNNQRRVKRAHQQQQQKEAKTQSDMDQTGFGSDGEGGPRIGSNEPRQKQLIFEKHFSYTSANQARGVYNNAPYSLPPQLFNDLGSGSENEQLKANNESAQATYQQHSLLDQLATKTQGRLQQQRKRPQPRKKTATGPRAGDLMNMTSNGDMIQTSSTNFYPVKRLGNNQTNLSNLDATTISGATSLTKGYRNITSQIKTISQEDTGDNAGVISTTSMFQKFVQPVMETQPLSQHRRPITASAAVGFRHQQRGGMVENTQAIYSQPSTTNIGLKSTANKIFRLPSATSGMSSMSNQFSINNKQQQQQQVMAENNTVDSNSNNTTPVGPRYQQQFAKFVSDKRIQWLNSGQHLKEVAQQSEDLSNSILNQTTVIPNKNNDQKSLSQFEDSDIPLQRRTKTQRAAVNHQRRHLLPQKVIPSIVSDAEGIEADSEMINPRVLNRETTPERKTQDFIEKIAPNIKHNDLYPKFVNRVKRQTPASMCSNSQNGDTKTHSERANSSVLVSGQNYEKDYQTAIQNIKQRKRSEAGGPFNRQIPQHPNGRVNKVRQPGQNYSMVNQSMVSFKDQADKDGGESVTSSRLNTKTFDQTPQGEYPKFVKNARKYTSQLNKFHPQQYQQQPSQTNKSLQRVGSSHSSQSRLTMNHHAIPVQSDNGVNYEQLDNVGTEVAVLPPEIKRVRHLSSGYVSSNSDNTAKVLISQHQQTRIGGLGNRLLISPKLGSIYGGEVTNCQFENKYHDQQGDSDGNESEETIMEKKRQLAQSKCLFPVVDWAFTPLFSRALSGDINFNTQQDISKYEEKEVDYVIDMMKNKYKEFKRSDIMRPFYLKAQLTLKDLLAEQGQDTHFERLMYKYKEVTIENTMKLLIRCKLNFHCRQLIYQILQQIIDYELQAVQFKDLVGAYPKHKVDQEDLEKINEQGKKVTHLGHQLLLQIKALRQVHSQFRKLPFLFKQRDYVNFVKNEMLEVRKLVGVFKVRTQEDIEEDEKTMIEDEQKRLARLIEKQKIKEMEQELERMGVDHTQRNETPIRQETSEYEEIQEVDPRSLLSPLRVVP